MDAEFAQLALWDFIRSVTHQIRAASGLRERNHFADGCFLGQNHDQPVESQGDSAVRRRAEFERFEQESEAALGFFFAEPERAENFLLHVAAVDTNRAGPELVAV